MKWATRPGIHVDRAASAWLIASYFDSQAEFLYVDDLDDVPETATPFDMAGCELSHRSGDVTFETILRHYDLGDPILWEVAEIIHQADVEDDRFDAPEAAGLSTLIRALGVDHNDEEVRLIASTLLTSLERYLRQAALNSGAPPDDATT